jgi:hypothetical protein
MMMKERAKHASPNTKLTVGLTQSPSEKLPKPELTNPAGQLTQLKEPSSEEYVFCLQGLHALLPCSDVKYPTGHGEHDTDAFRLEKLPRAQGTHSNAAASNL